MHKASSLQCIHYADDTTLFSKGNNLDDLTDFTNTELVKIDKWVCANKLSLNINKTAFSICSTKPVTDVRTVNYFKVNLCIPYLARIQIFLCIILNDIKILLISEKNTINYKLLNQIYTA